MLCPNCAATLSETAKFCSNCGTAVAVAAGSPYADATAAAAEPQAAPYQAQATQAGQAAQAAAAQPEQSPFERGYQQGYAWASGEQAPPQAEPVQQGWQQQQSYGQPESPYAQQPQPYAPTAKNKVAAGLLGIFLGSLGIHKFYLGYSKEGVIMLLVTLLGSLLTFGLAAAAMQIIGIIEGVIYLTRSDEEFYYTYDVGNKTWF